MKNKRSKVEDELNKLVRRESGARISDLPDIKKLQSEVDDTKDLLFRSDDNPGPSSHIAFRLGKALAALGSYDHAQRLRARLNEKAEELGTRKLDHWLNKAVDDAQIARGDYESVIKSIEQKPWSIYKVVEKAIRIGDLDWAEQQLKSRFSVGEIEISSDINHNAQLAIAAWLLEDYDKIKPALDRYRKHNEADDSLASWATARYVLTLTHCGRSEEAEQLWFAELDTDPIRQNIGTTHFCTALAFGGDFERAQKIAKEHFPDDTAKWRGLYPGLCAGAMEQGDQTAAQRFVTEYLELLEAFCNAATPDVLFQLNEAARSLGELISMGRNRGADDLALLVARRYIKFAERFYDVFENETPIGWLRDKNLPCDYTVAPLINVLPEEEMEAFAKKNIYFFYYCDAYLSSLSQTHELGWRRAIARSGRYPAFRNTFPLQSRVAVMKDLIKAGSADLIHSTFDRCCEIALDGDGHHNQGLSFAHLAGRYVGFNSDLARVAALLGRLEQGEQLLETIEKGGSFRLNAFADFAKARAWAADIPAAVTWADSRSDKLERLAAKIGVLEIAAEEFAPRIPGSASPIFQRVNQAIGLFAAGC